MSEGMLFFGFCLLVINVVALIIVLFTILPARVEARLYNAQFGTCYTTWEFVCAGDTIKSFLNKGKQETQNFNFDKPIELKISE